MHERATRAADLDRLALLEHLFGNRLKKARGLRRHELAVAAPSLRVRQKKLALGARDSDVEKPALFLEHRGILERLRKREESALEAGDEDDGELEPLRVVQRHHRHGIGIRTELVQLGDEHGLLQEVVELSLIHIS